MNKATLKLCVSLLSLINVPANAANIYGIVIGVDEYKNFQSLDGAVNDAKVVADALKAVGSKQVITLLNGKASREGIKKAWKEVTTQAKPGDTVLLTYAGHGSQLPERVKGTEADGLDEFYVLGNFNTSGKSTYERIVDDDLQEWFSKRPDLNIILVSDSCHSGTMTRGYKTSKLKYRKVQVKSISNDALPLPENAEVIDEQKTRLAHVTSFSGVPDNEEVPEVAINNQLHGAMSWYFAQGIRGEADDNNDGVVSLSELKSYLIEKVRMTTEGQQHPQINFAKDMGLVQQQANANRQNTVSFRVVNNPGDSAAIDNILKALKNIQPVQDKTADLNWDVAGQKITDKANTLVYDFAATDKTKGYKRKTTAETETSPELLNILQPVVDQYLNKNQKAVTAPLSGRLNTITFSLKYAEKHPQLVKALSAKLTGIEFVSAEKALLELDTEAWVIRNPFNDVVYSITDPNNANQAYRPSVEQQNSPPPQLITQIQAVIDKFKLVETLKALSDGSLEIKLLPSNKLHTKGESISFTVDHLKYPYFTLINLAVDGTINFLYPQLQKDELSVATSKPFLLDDLEVSEPYGADHFLAIASDKPLTGLHDSLKSLNNTKNTLEDLKNALSASLKDCKYQIGIHASFTASSL